MNENYLDLIDEDEYEDDYEEDTEDCEKVLNALNNDLVYEYGYQLVRQRTDDGVIEVEFPDMDGKLSGDDIEKIVSCLENNTEFSVSVEVDGDFTTFYLE